MSWKSGFSSILSATGATSSIAPQVLRLLDSAIFNALIGNNHTHAENYSLLYSGKTRRRK